MPTRMKRIGSNGSANTKIVTVNREMGNPNIGSQQGTTRIIYDAVPLVTSATNQNLVLFQDCRTRKFPLTNLTENKLQKGESLTIQRISYFIMECAAGTTNPLTIVPLAYFAGLVRLYTSQYTFSIAQTAVLKQIPIFSTYAPFNPDARFLGTNQIQTFAAGAPTSDLQNFPLPHDNFEMKTNLVIPVDLEFKNEVLIPPVTTPAGFDFYFGMTIEGVGSLFAPKGNF